MRRILLERPRSHLPGNRRLIGRRPPDVVRDGSLAHLGYHGTDR